MLLLGILFIIQFSISVAALAIGNNQQDSIAAAGWCALSDADKNDLQNAVGCFGFVDLNPANYNSTVPVTALCMAPGSTCPSSMFVSRCKIDMPQLVPPPTSDGRIVHSMQTLLRAGRAMAL